MLADVDAGPTFPPSLKHAHNDYEHTRPLLDALDQKFESVEADLWLDGTNELGVSHAGPPFKGSLKSLYLDPLAQRIADHNGSVYGDGKPFFLWLDLKDGSTALQDVLAAQLAGYSFLTQFDDSGVSTQGAVTVLLTGDDKAKKALVNARAAPRPYSRDSNDYTTADPPSDGKWSTYAVNYDSFMQWDGAGTIPRAQQRQLENLINGAHATGRSIRIYSSPDTPAYWAAAKAAHLDFINTDKLAELASAL